MSKPLLSIIIPTFNSEETIELCLNSIVNQELKDVEVIIVDGLSSDITLEKVQQYSERIPNLEIISEADKGIYDAMNKGIERSHGRWLYFMGSDDAFYDDKVLMKIFSHKDIEKTDVIYGNVYSDFLGGIYDGQFTERKIINQNICHQSIFFKRDVFKKTGLFSLKYKLLSDWHHNIKWMLDTTISSMFIYVTVANYGDGGLSSTQIDEVFLRDKPLILFFKGFKTYDYSQLILFCTEIIEHKENSTALKLIFKMFRFSLRKIRKFKK